MICIHVLFVLYTRSNVIGLKDSSKRADTDNLEETFLQFKNILVLLHCLFVLT